MGSGKPIFKELYGIYFDSEFVITKKE